MDVHPPLANINRFNGICDNGSLFIINELLFNFSIIFSFRLRSMDVHQPLVSVCAF
jgi:hypothetical protein